jgi:hypothetical protein
MRYLGSLFVFLIIASSCGVDTSKKETITEETVSKTAHEEIMQIINDCNITIPKNLEFSEVTRDSTIYKIEYKGEGIDEVAKDQIEDWLIEQTERLSEEYWGKRIISNNNQLLGIQTNEVVMIKPENSKVNVENNIKISTSYNYKSQIYTLVFTAN